MTVEIEDATRALFEARSQRKQPWTDDDWERVKQSLVFRSTLRALREEAVQMIEDGEFDD